MNEGNEAITGAGPQKRAAAGTAPDRPTLRSILAIDEREHLVEFAQTSRGKLLIVTVFTGLLMTGQGAAWWQSLLIGAAAAACAYVPRYRALTVFVATFALLFHALWFPLNGIDAAMRQEHVDVLSARTFACIAVVVYTFTVWSALTLVRRHKTLLIARRPVIALLLIEAALCGLVCMPVVHGLPRVLLWSYLTVFTANIWFFSYALVDQRSRERSPVLFQLGLFHPFWGSTATPWGKGAAFLRKTLAKTPAELAVTQLKAIKLLTWSCVLLDLTSGLAWVCASWLHIPNLESVQAAQFRHHPYPLPVAWASLILDTTFDALWLAVWGHRAIAVARLAGFRLPRNTWRPLESRTLAEFWNRYYYYFKELLVEFFFLPTFLRTFRNHPRLRVFFSTFMAAGVGNALYHFIRDISLVATIGLSATIESFTSYLFYCAVLATGIGLSQARSSAGARLPSTFSGRFGAFLWIWTFVVCLHVFGNETRFYTLDQRLSFMASLVGVN